MSNEQAKLKNSTRRHRDESAVKRQVKIAKQHGFQHNDDVMKQPHRLSKHHAMDCGDPGCMLCGNPRHNKSLKGKEKLTTQERRFYQDLDSTNDRHSNGVLPKDIDD